MSACLCQPHEEVLDSATRTQIFLQRGSGRAGQYIRERLVWKLESLSLCPSSGPTLPHPHPLLLPLPSPAGAVQEETDHFLSKKSEWKAEIEQKLEELKLAESALSSKEQELKKVCMDPYVLLVKCKLFLERAAVGCSGKTLGIHFFPEC